MTIQELVQGNHRKSHLPCSHPGCTRNRKGLSSLCHSHYANQRKYGHPNGRPLKHGEYQREFDTVGLFLEAFKDHPAITSATALFNTWLTEASLGKSVVGRKSWELLYRKGATPDRLLHQVLAVWLYSLREPRRLPDDKRLSYALTREMIKTVGFARKSYGDSYSETVVQPSVEDLTSIGEKIRLTLVKVFINMVAYLDAKQQEANQAALNLSVPFSNQES